MQICRVKKLMENESNEKLYNRVTSKGGSSKTTLNYDLCYAVKCIAVSYRGRAVDGVLPGLKPCKCLLLETKEIGPPTKFQN